MRLLLCFLMMVSFCVNAQVTRMSIGKERANKIDQKYKGINAFCDGMTHSAALTTICKAELAAQYEAAYKENTLQFISQALIDGELKANDDYKEQICVDQHRATATELGVAFLAGDNCSQLKQKINAHIAAQGSGSGSGGQ